MFTKQVTSEKFKHCLSFIGVSHCWMMRSATHEALWLRQWGAGSCWFWYEVDLQVGSRIWSIFSHQSGDCWSRTFLELRKKKMKKRVESSSVQFWSTPARKDLLKNNRALEHSSMRSCPQRGLHDFRWFFVYLCYFSSLSLVYPYCNLFIHQEDDFMVLEEIFFSGWERINFIVNNNL